MFQEKPRELEVALSLITGVVILVNYPLGYL
jgi:hypothetical protein